MTNYDTSLSNYLKGFSFASNFVYNLNTDEISNANVFSYQVNPKLSAKLLMNIMDGDIEFGGRIIKQVYTHLSVEGFLNYSKNKGAFDLFSVSTNYKLNDQSTAEIEYINPIVERKSPKHQTFFLTQGIWRLKWMIIANKFNTLGFDYTWNLDKNMSNLAIGIENTALDKTILKAKINKIGELESTVKFNWSQNASFIASTKFNLSNLQSEAETDFGIGVEYNC
jgi:hypothetical protein